MARYIRFNRKRLKGEAGQEEASLALWTLGEVLFTQSLVMSPFAPFFSEWSYLKLRPHIKSAVDSAATAAAAPQPTGVSQAAAWSVDDVANWLASCSLDGFTDAFKKNNISGESLLRL